MDSLTLRSLVLDFVLFHRITVSKSQIEVQCLIHKYSDLWQGNVYFTHIYLLKKFPIKNATKVIPVSRIKGVKIITIIHITVFSKILCPHLGNVHLFIFTCQCAAVLSKFSHLVFREWFFIWSKSL